MPKDHQEPQFVLRKPLERTICAGHPWIYRDAVTGSAPVGAVAKIVNPSGTFVARGIADAGPIALRVVTLRDEAISPELFAARIARAGELRRRVVPPPPETDAYRLLHGEGDRLPGWVCDVYGQFAVFKTDGAGAQAWRDAAVTALSPEISALGVKTLLLRTPGSDTEARDGQNDGRVVVAFGTPPPARLAVREHGMILLTDLLRGQKTGLFLDQRESRWRVRQLALGLRVLNLYGYTGGFSVAAGLGNATSVETVDVAKEALVLAEASWAANGLDPARHRTVAASVPEHLAALARKRARFDLVIADPPSFAPREDTVPAALKSYRSLHSAALSVLAPGGYYLAASCSSHVNRANFEATVFEGARRAHRLLQWLDTWGPPPDHPRPAGFPEGDYLKVLLFRAE